MIRLPRRGTWTPLLPLHARLIAAGVIPAVPLFYGIDYLLPGRPTPSPRPIRLWSSSYPSKRGASSI